MQYLTLLTSLLLAPAALAASNATTSWGYWLVSNASYSLGPANPTTFFNFNVKYLSQANAIACSNNYPDANSLTETCICEDSSLTCEFGESRTDITLTQKLAQRGAIATIRGSGSLDMVCTVNVVSGGQDCVARTTPFNVTEISTMLPRNYVV